MPPPGGAAMERLPQWLSIYPSGSPRAAESNLRQARKHTWIQYCFTQDSTQNIIQFKENSAYSIQKIIQFNSQ